MRTIAGLLFTLALLATACGSGSGETSVAAAGGDDGPQSFEDLDFTSPIGDFLGFDFSATDDMEEQFAEMEREAGRITAACMREQGFEWSPPDTGNITSFGGPGGDLPYFSDEWVAKYGFGITTQRFPQSAVGDLVGYPDEDFGGPDGDFVDPNQEYVESLSEGEREAYQEALWGQPPDFGEDGPSEDFEFEPSGCQGEAFEEAFSNGPGGNFQGFFETFGDELQAMEERARSDSRVVEFNNNVTDCVSEAGMIWVDQEELYERFENRLREVQPDAFRGGDPFEGSGLDPETMSEREIEEYFNDLNKLDSAGLATLGELQAEEISLAEVVTGCGGGPLNEQVVLGDIRAEYEQDFLDANAAGLEQFKSE